MRWCASQNHGMLVFTACFQNNWLGATAECRGKEALHTAMSES